MCRKVTSLQEEDLPGIVHQLTLAQSATFVNANGVTIRVRAEPKERLRFRGGRGRGTGRLIG